MGLVKTLSPGTSAASFNVWVALAEALSEKILALTLSINGFQSSRRGNAMSVSECLLDSQATQDTLPLIIFVHIPKTAGTTVRDVLYDTSVRGQALYQGELHAPDFLARAAEVDWLSGHVTHDIYREYLQPLERQVEFFTTLRDPFKQIVSHLKHSFSRYHQENGEQPFDDVEAEIDRDVATTDFGSVDAIIELLRRQSDWFLNIQSRYVLGADYASLSDAERVKRLSAYACISTEHTLKNIYKAWGFLKLPADAVRIHNNRNESTLDTSLLDAPQIRDFLAEHHGHDFRLYSLVQTMNFPAVKRVPYRPSFFPLVRRVTADNFNEEAYLAVNPDVAAAVEAGIFQTGYDHFEIAGHMELRYQKN